MYKYSSGVHGACTPSHIEIILSGEVLILTSLNNLKEWSENSSIPSSSLYGTNMKGPFHSFVWIHMFTKLSIFTFKKLCPPKTHPKVYKYLHCIVFVGVPGDVSLGPREEKCLIKYRIGSFWGF